MRITVILYIITIYFGCRIESAYFPIEILTNHKFQVHGIFEFDLGAHF